VPKFGYLRKKTVLSSGTLFQTLDFKKFCHGNMIVLSTELSVVVELVDVDDACATVATTVATLWLFTVYYNLFNCSPRNSINLVAAATTQQHQEVTSESFI